MIFILSFLILTPIVAILMSITIGKLKFLIGFLYLLLLIILSIYVEIYRIFQTETDSNDALDHPLTRMMRSEINNRPKNRKL